VTPFEAHTEELDPMLQFMLHVVLTAAENI